MIWLAAVRMGIPIRPGEIPKKKNVSFLMGFCPRLPETWRLVTLFLKNVSLCHVVLEIHEF